MIGALLFAVAFAASSNPLDYPNMGLPSDALVLGDQPLAGQILELTWVNRYLYAESIETQSKYADMVFRSNTNDSDWVQHVLDHEVSPFEKWVACSVGNIAYIALHAPLEHQREAAKSYLKQYREWKEYQWLGMTFAKKEFPNMVVMFMHPIDCVLYTLLYYYRLYK